MVDRLARTLGLLLMASVAGCSFAPPYRPPVIAPPVAFKESGPWQVAVPADAGVRTAWWSGYGDDRLNALEAELTTANPTLAGALGRYDEARAYLAQARAGLFPTIGLDADLTRERQSDNRPLRGATQPDYYSADAVGASVGYELDLWGRVRNAVAAGHAEAEASSDDVAALQLALQAKLADTYFELRGYDAEIDLLSATVDAYAKADALTRRRFAGGIATGIDTGRSGAQLAEAQAQLAEVRSARALTEHAIASLVGTPASSFSIPVQAVDLAVPAVPVGLPSTLLQRRADVAAAERRMAAANATIGIAKAAFFPSISLGGQGGFQNTGLPGLFTAPNIFWSIGPSAVLSLFDGGRRRAQLAVARASWTKATAAYREDVLKAFQDVEDGLSDSRNLADEATAEARAQDQAAQAERLSLNRFVKGAVTYLDVVTAQTTALRTRREVIALHTRRLRASVALATAVGGGWSSPRTTG